jgi:ABC-type polysaccharide/polyol phosphate transport system ATPase subunit
MNDRKEIAISVKDVGKRFKLYDDPILGPIKELSFFWRKKGLYKDFWAIKHLSFEVHKGEIVGLIGPNGAGKTTILKMIAGLLNVDEGQISVNGKVTALLVMGLGFNPEFTGRENILYGGMLLGMSKPEVVSKMDSIIEFSELRNFIDQPFRTYSAGMKSRLIFATSMAIDPEILIVDETLATGDAYYVIKCMERIHEICSQGTTVLYVSHNIPSLKRICNRAIRLDKGRLIADGSVTEVCDGYLDDLLYDVQVRRSITGHRELDLDEHQAIGTMEATVEDVEIDGYREVIRTGDPMTLSLIIRAKKVIDPLFFTLQVYRLQDGAMSTVLGNRYFFNSDDKEGAPHPLRLDPGLHRLDVEVPAIWLNTGSYTLDLYLFDKEYVTNQVECLYFKRAALRFDVQCMNYPYADNVLFTPSNFRIRKI